MLGGRIADCRKLGGKGTPAGPVVIGGDVQVKCFVRALQIVGRSPLVEVGLAFGQGLVAPVLENLFGEAAVKAFAFALRLGVVGLAMDQVDAEPKEPRVEPRKEGPSGALSPGHPPGCAVVTEDPPWEAVAPESGRQPRLNRLELLVGAGLKPDRKAGVVVHNRQWVAPLATGRWEVALEVHLPKLVGLGLLEVLEGLSVPVRFGIDQPIALYDRLTGRSGRHLLGAERELPVLGPSLEAASNLAAAPGRVPIAHLADGLLDVLGRPVWRFVRAPRPLFEAFLALLAVAGQPLVAGGPADVEPSAQDAHVGVFLVGKLGEFESQRHLGSGLPGHGYLGFSGGTPAADNVLRMSPNTC